MELILKQYDIPLLRFSATNDSCTPEIEVHWINEDQRHLLPLDMDCLLYTSPSPRDRG